MYFPASALFAGMNMSFAQLAEWETLKMSLEVTSSSPFHQLVSIIKEGKNNFSHVVGKMESIIFPFKARKVHCWNQSNYLVTGAGAPSTGISNDSC